MKSVLFFYTFVFFFHICFAQIYEESRYQLMLNYKFKSKNTLSFQPEMRVKNYVQSTTITLWRMIFIRQLNDKAHAHLGMDWFNNWHNYDVTGNEIRLHTEAGLKDKYGQWTYFNRYRLDCRNYYDHRWNYLKTIYRMRYMINWSIDLLHNDKGQKLTLYLADEVFLNIAGTKKFNIYDQNRLGGYLIFKMNEHLSFRSSYWWEYRSRNNYVHLWWIQLGYNI